MRWAMPPRRASGLLALVLAAVAGASSPALAAPTAARGLRWSTSVDATQSEPGSTLVFELSVEGLTAASARVDELRLDPGLALESETTRPFVTLSSKGTAFRFELRVLEASILRIQSLKVSAAEGRLELGPLVVCDASAFAQDSKLAWRWVAPPEALRYEAFEIRLEPVVPEGGSVPEEAATSFAPPPGASFEASGHLAWTVIAFEEGSLLLPEVSLSAGKASGSAASARVAIKALPPSIASSRAIGSFSLALTGPEPPSPRVGETIQLRLVLSGRGNLPALLLPGPLINLPARAWTSNRVDEARAEGGSYIGRASLALVLDPVKPGLLSIRFPPLAVYDPALGEGSLSLPPLELRVASAPALPASRAGGGAALAALYHALRQAPPLSPASRNAKKAALERASELGTGLPLLDLLPPPPWFLLPAGLALLGWLGRRFLPGRGRKRDKLLSPPGLLLALSLALALAGLAAALERRASYAVVWTDTLRIVPAADSELFVKVVKGSTARSRGSSGGFESLVFPDGVEGWAARESLYWY
jgi:hypothetical protein